MARVHTFVEKHRTAEPRLLMRARGYEAWARWDREARVWEVFASEACDDYLGCCDSWGQAVDFARQSITERAGA